ncbi:hypothetical protein VTJ83DRAFT_3956 [Remersonia thermophila]|uniref:MYND-type domain-containing protein n=1 Tax=Remersonia thermophila TaxID=72144 RepID=A0ABR4DFL5_9PEZI
MPLPDFTSSTTFPPFAALPFKSSSKESNDGGADDYYLLAQISQDMTLTKPTLILTDSTSATFALVFDSRPGAGPETLNLRSMGLKPGATLCLRGARRGLPPSKEGEGESSGKQGHVVVSRVEEGRVRAIPAGLDKVVALGGWLSGRDLQRAEGRGKKCESCHEQNEEAKGLKKCTGCGEVEYCSKECQIKAWNDGHKADCKVIKAIRSIWPVIETGYLAPKEPNPPDLRSLHPFFRPKIHQYTSLLFLSSAHPHKRTHRREHDERGGNACAGLIPRRNGLRIMPEGVRL